MKTFWGASKRIMGPGPARGEVDPDGCCGASNTLPPWRLRPLSSPGHFPCVAGGEVDVASLSPNLPRPLLPSWGLGCHVNRGLCAWPASWGQGAA